MNTYLGGKGYTILKSALTLEQQVKIRNDLMIKPFVMGSPMNDAKTFPVYRESAKKNVCSALLWYKRIRYSKTV